ncbi:MAG: ECF transporter S component [Candidatus Diapherotrites archaeon]|uniref:ECF transporter S component n=1 Tax=Candidatus Iainarchaeum sp. TaxID=3101447 RepID=A0A939C987_9ARCH|nr:ECF transporter S component [Candidatus Diapherotrites archaeon]
MHRYKLLIGSAMLAAVSVLLQIYKIAYPFAGFIDIDAVGVPWIIATFLFGLFGGVVASIVSAIGIAVFAPTGPVGAAMKFIATIVMVLIVGLIVKKFGYGKKGLAIAFALCLAARPAIMVFFNYYIGIPLFFGIPTETAIEQFPVELFIIPNMILAAIDFWIAYLLVFGTRLKERLHADD